MIDSEESYKQDMEQQRVTSSSAPSTCLEQRVLGADSCLYCSKYLFGLNDFNRKMHIETCKVRKLIESQQSSQFNNNSGSNSSNSNGSNNNQQSQNGENNASGLNLNNQLEDYMILGENCSYCFKSFKDFKNDFNKRLHIKCCKIKKETYERKNKYSMSNGGSISLLNNSTSGDTNALESCLFCTKLLGNLNEFNKRMHIENCKIRKSIEGNFNQSLLLNSSLDSLNKSLKIPIITPNNNNANGNNNNNNNSNVGNGNGEAGLKKENGLSVELGNQCIYCSKLFVNLSDFNKRLHFEYCKLKKKKLQELNLSNGNYNNNNNNSQNGGQSLNVNLVGNVNVNNNNNQQQQHHHHHQQHQHQQQQQQQHHHQQQQQQHINNIHIKSSNNNNNKIIVDLGDSCMFCSRSLMNLSNFNKKVHIETCKIKQLKKATAMRMRQQNMSTKSNKKRCKKEMQNNYNNINSTLIENLGIEAVTNNLNQQQQQQYQQVIEAVTNNLNQQQQQQYQQVMNSSGLTSLNLDQHSAIHSVLNQNLNTSSVGISMVQHLIPITLSGQIEQINQNSNGIFI